MSSSVSGLKLANSKCSICFEEPTNPVIPGNLKISSYQYQGNCFKEGFFGGKLKAVCEKALHVFCENCLSKNLSKLKERVQVFQCPCCRKEYDTLMPLESVEKVNEPDSDLEDTLFKTERAFTIAFDKIKTHKPLAFLKALSLMKGPEPIETIISLIINDNSIIDAIAEGITKHLYKDQELKVLLNRIIECYSNKKVVDQSQLYSLIVSLGNFSKDCLRVKKYSQASFFYKTMERLLVKNFEGSRKAELLLSIVNGYRHIEYFPEMKGALDVLVEIINSELMPSNKIELKTKFLILKQTYIRLRFLGAVEKDLLLDALSKAKEMLLNLEKLALTSSDDIEGQSVLLKNIIKSSMDILDENSTNNMFEEVVKVLQETEGQRFLSKLDIEDFKNMVDRSFNSLVAMAKSDDINQKLCSIVSISECYERIENEDYKKCLVKIAEEELLKVESMVNHLDLSFKVVFFKKISKCYLNLNKESEAINVLTKAMRVRHSLLLLNETLPEGDSYETKKRKIN
jgi:hypothetical protein